MFLEILDWISDHPWITVFIIVAIIVICFIVRELIYRHNLSWGYVNVLAKVIEKKYHPGHWVPQVMNNGETTFISQIYYPPQYIVKIKYDSYIQSFDNELLFNQVKIGDFVPVILWLGRDQRENKITRWRFDFE